MSARNGGRSKFAPLIPVEDPPQAANGEANATPGKAAERDPWSTTTVSTPLRRHPLSLISLVVLVFYGVSGGPFGVEAAVSAGGPLLTLSGFLILPLVWALPEALVTAELSSAFPEAAGFVAWVEEAYGPFAGFMEGYMSWLSGVTDNSLYPVLFLEYILAMVGETSILHSGYPRFFFLTSITLALVYVNYRGLEVVGRTALVICLFSLLPFFIMVVLGIPLIDTSRWLLPPAEGWESVRWTPFLNILFWSLNYWDSAASFAGEVHDPGRTFPLAMAWALLLVVVAYAVPLLVGIGATRGSVGEWTDGYFAKVGSSIAGPWLGVWIVAAAGISNVGMFIAELSSDSFQVMGMAERGMLPSLLTKRSRHGTPTRAIFLSTVGIIVLGVFSFEEIVEMLNFLYCFAELLEFAAFLKLRASRPDLQRPFSIPLGTKGCALLLFPPSLLTLFIVSCASTRTWMVCGGMIILGVFIYMALGVAKKMNIFEFHEEPLVDHHHPFRRMSSATWSETTPLVTSGRPLVTESMSVDITPDQLPLTGK
eukprot:Sspe_Gene.89280::Locus_61074_Transcript_1_1_Confidence_1.000_Length_1660::g.89280::m.89280